MRKHLIAIIICCASGNLYAQQNYTLKSCLETGLEKNYSIRMVRNEEQISKNNATIANAGYLPTLDLSAGLSGSINDTETEKTVDVPESTKILIELRFGNLVNIYSKSQTIERGFVIGLSCLKGTK